MKLLIIFFVVISLSSYSQTGTVGVRLNDSEIPDTIPPDPGDTTTHTTGPRVCLIFEITAETSPTPVIPIIIGPQLQTSTMFVNPTNGACCTWSLNIVTDTPLFGTRALLAHLNKTDPQPSGSSRAEWNQKSTGEPELNFERWYGLGMRPSSDYTNDQAADAFTQVHANDNLSPPVALWTLNGKYRLALNGLVTGENLGNVVPGQWERWEMHIKWDTDGTHGGLIEIYKNEVLVATRSGANSPGGVTYGPYWKLGIYKWPWKTGSHYTSDATVREYEFDEVRMGGPCSNLASVTPDF